MNIRTTIRPLIEAELLLLRQEHDIHRLQVIGEQSRIQRLEALLRLIDAEGDEASTEEGAREP